MEKEECRVCNNLVEITSVESIFVTSKYTKTPIPDLIQSLLDADESNRFNANDGVCQQCLHKFNQYDLAYITFKRVAAELKNILIITEPAYFKDELIEYTGLDEADNLSETEDDIAVHFQRYQDEYDSEQTERPQTNENDENVKIADINGENEQIEYLEVEEPLAYEESGDNVVEAHNDPDDDESAVMEDAPDDDADWRDIPEWESWLECIDGNEKELHCKSCKLNVVALKSFVVKHAHSRLHSLRMNVVDHSPEAIELVETVEPPKDANSSPGRTKRIIATKQYTQRVRHVWKSQPKFESWLQIFDDDDSRVQCKFCDMEMSAKKSVLQKHGQSKKHIENMNVAYKSIDDNTSQIGIDAAWLCPNCQSGFCDEKLLKIHIQKSHKTMRCAICDQIFQTPSELKTHQETDHEMGKYVCHICGKELKSASYLSRHIAIHETGQTVSLDQTGQNVFRCDLCGQVEQNESELQTHIALHDNKLKCVVCGSVVKHKGNLILHMRIHTGEKFYQCDKCGKEFIHKSSLRMHLATTHTVERKKQCSQCTLSFKTTSQLNQHRLTHTGEKNHKCPECSKCFAQRYNMMAHYKLHMGIGRHSKKNVCPICNITFEKPSQLEQHCKKIHFRAS